MIKRKFVSLKEGYAEWAKTYDVDANLALVCGEKVLKKVLHKRISGKKVLDIGCGTGRWLAYFAEKGAEVYGIDISKEMLTVAKKKVPSAKLKIADAAKIPFSKNKFDLAISVLVFSHILDTQKALNEIARVLKPNSLFFISMIRPDWIGNMLDPKHPERRHYVRKGINYSIKDVYHKSPHLLSMQFKDAGFKLIKIHKVRPTKKEVDLQESVPDEVVGKDFMWIYELRKK